MSLGRKIAEINEPKEDEPMSDKHTPKLPLEYEHERDAYAVRDATGRVVLEVVGNDHIPFNQIIGEIKHIVRCVNSHNALVDALRDCISILHGIVYRFGDVTYGMNDTISDAEQALKDAEGE